MASVIELKERAAGAAEDARTVKDKADSEDRTMTVEEGDTLSKHLELAARYEREADLQEKLEKTEERIKTVAPAQTKPEIGDHASLKIPAQPKHYRFGSLKSFTGPNADFNAYKSGRWLHGVVAGNADSRQWCRDHGIEMRVQTEGVNTAGGWLVPDELETAIIDLRETYGMFRQEARVLPMSSDHMIIPRRTSGVTAYFPGETTATTASDVAWNNVELTAKKCTALTRMSTDLAEDAIISIADAVADEMAWAFAKKEDECGIDGDGTATYGGMVGMRVAMLTGASTGAFFAGATNDNWSEVLDADLTSTQSLVPAYALANAKWYCSNPCKIGVFDRLTLAAGGATATERAEGVTPQYNGYPIVTSAAMPSTDGVGLNATIMLWFGNLKLSTTMGIRRGITLKVSTDRYLEYDQVGILATERFVIVNHDFGGAAGVTGPVAGLQANT